MTPNARQSYQLPPQESLLLDYVQRLERHREGRRAVWLHLSRLKPYNRRPQHLRIANSILEPVAARFDGSLFNIFNGDAILICKNARIADIDEAVLRLRYLFSDDPLLAAEAGEADPFSTWYDIAEDHSELLSVALGFENASQSGGTAVSDDQNDSPRASTQSGMPLDPQHFAIIAQSISGADLSTMTLRQMIYQFIDEESPLPILEEVYVSIDALRQTLMPDFDLCGNPWLFQDLTRYLDQRVIQMLLQNNDDKWRRSFSINLNVSSVLSPEFLEFDRVLTGKARNSIVVELQSRDIFADLQSFSLARDFLKERGYRLCLDGLTQHGLGYIDREKLGFDIVKIFWSEELADSLRDREKELLASIEAIGDHRLVLARCDSPNAIATGKALGISLFQGFTLDDQKPDIEGIEDEARILGGAINRHRTARRAETLKS